VLLLPYNAEHYYFVADAERTQFLSRAARERQIQDHGIAAGAQRRWSTLFGRIGAGFDGVWGRLVRVRGGGPAKVGDGVAANPSA
jgi:hypothetical protein